MTRGGIELLREKYTSILRRAGVRPQQVDINKHLSPDQMLGHCLWVLEDQIEPVLHRVGGFQEAVRLLGCIQGTAMACGLCTIADTREHAREAGITTWDRIVGDS